MKLIRLSAENFLRLAAVEITPDGAVVQISGANGAGKSSVLRALEAALGGKDAIPTDAVRHGADRASITADLGEFIVRRIIKADGSTTLAVETREGAKYPSPQKMLDGLLGALSFDPLAFSRMKAKDQRNQLADMVGLSAMLDGLAMHDRADYDARSIVNRELRSADVRLADMPNGPACEPVDISATMADIRAARATNAAIGKQSEARESRRHETAKSRAGAATYRAEAERLLNLADQCEADADAINNELSALEPLPALVDVAAIEATLDTVEAQNAQHRAYVERQTAAGLAGKLREESETITVRMQARDAERAAVIQAAHFPIPGLALTDDGVTYRAVPFDQASSAEQLRVSAAIGMALNPSLRVMLIRDGSLLDATSLQMLTDAAEAEDFLLLIEQVDTTGTVGVYIEDGRVSAINGVPVEVAA